jgi:polyisoprenoid-binding protein YceI
MAEPLALNVAEIPLSASNTLVEFSVRWLGVLTVRGTFATVSGMLHVPDGDLARASVHAEVALATVDTGIALRDRHLRGPKFFDAPRGGTAAFRGGSIMRWPSHWTLPGSLTIGDATSTEELTCAVEEREGGCVVRATTLVDRRRFGIGVVGGVRRLNPLYALIGDDVRVDILLRLPRDLCV